MSKAEDRKEANATRRGRFSMGFSDGVRFATVDRILGTDADYNEGYDRGREASRAAMNAFCAREGVAPIDPPQHTKKVASLIADAAEAVERIPEDELEDYAGKLRKEAMRKP